MPRKNDKEKLDNVTLKIKQLEAQKKQLESRVKEKERKARTRRLIQQGAILDTMGIDSVEMTNKFKEDFQNNQEFKNWLETNLQKNIS